MILNINPLSQADFYKTGHIFQYPAGTTEVYSNLTPRSDRLAPVLRDRFDSKIVWFGLQGFIKTFLIEIWNANFFRQPKATVVARYKRRLDCALGPDAVDVSHIEQLHDLGYLPIEIKALPEGSRVDIRVPTLTIRNTDDGRFYWVTNYLETLLSNELWKPSTVATIAYEYRRLLEDFAERTGAPRAFIDWQGHDFSARGMSGALDSMSAAAGHLLSFYGTDTIAAIDYLEDRYNADAEREMVGGSVPATEHSVMCLGGQEGEIATFRRLITELYPSGVVSIVSDTWDFWKVITEYARELKPQILARTPNAIGLAKVVFRPDSGDPVRILAGYRWMEIEDASALSEAIALGAEAVKIGGRYAIIDTVDGEPVLRDAREAEIKGAVECLWDLFGGTETERGFRVLHERVGLIYGDSITLARAEAILSALERKGFASCNVVFGIGSYTYQYLTRDSFGWAVKATSGIVNGQRIAVQKDPVTDNGAKKSARGLLRVEKEGGRFVLHDDQTEAQAAQGELRTVFVDGRLLIDEDLATIRARLGAVA